jgi:chorismate-pyruvate lyase
MDIPMRDPVAGRAAASGAGDHNSILFPLDAAYAQAGVDGPTARRIHSEDIPDPYRALLVHEGNMTATLEHHFHGAVGLQLLSAVHDGSWFLRRVLLVHESSGRPLAMAAVCMRVDGFTELIQAQIRRGEIPLGRILLTGGVEFTSRPRAFLSFTADPEMMERFSMRESRTLYGRQTELFCLASKIGDVVEVLARA